MAFVTKRLSHLVTSGSDGCELEYILCPADLAALAKINRKPDFYDYKYPEYWVDMNLTAFHLQFNNNQVQALLLLLESFDRMQAAAPYRKWRPDVSSGQCGLIN